MVYMQTEPRIARTRPPHPNQEMPIVIDDGIRNCVADLADRQERHEAKQHGKREGCSFTKLQQKNIDDLIRKHGITRPIYVWERGEEWVIVDGHKVYEAAERIKAPYEVRIVDLASTEDAKAWRWYVNVSANRRLTEDAIVFQFLNKFQDVIEEWRQQGKENQGWRKNTGSEHPKSKLFEDREKMNWMLKAAEVCQTTKYHIEKTQDLWRAAQSVAKLTEEERAALTSKQIDNIKKIENGVAAVLSGASSKSVRYIERSCEKTSGKNREISI